MWMPCERLSDRRPDWRMELQSDYPWRSRWRKTKHVCKVRIEGEKHLIFCDREVFEFSRLAGLKVPFPLRQLHRVLFLEGSPLVVAKDSYREEVSRGEDNFVAGETRSGGVCRRGVFLIPLCHTLSSGFWLSRLFSGWEVL